MGLCAHYDAVSFPADMDMDAVLAEQDSSTPQESTARAEASARSWREAAADFMARRRSGHSSAAQRAEPMAPQSTQPQKAASSSQARRTKAEAAALLAEQEAKRRVEAAKEWMRTNGSKARAAVSEASSARAAAVEAEAAAIRDATAKREVQMAAAAEAKAQATRRVRRGQQCRPRAASLQLSRTWSCMLWAGFACRALPRCRKRR